MSILINFGYFWWMPTFKIKPTNIVIGFLFITIVFSRVQIFKLLILLKGKSLE